jgi:hypothetical protein
MYNQFSNEKPSKFLPSSTISALSLYDSTEQLVNSSSKLEISASEVRIGTNGALIDLESRAFQLTF